MIELQRSKIPHFNPLNKLIWPLGYKIFSRVDNFWAIKKNKCAVFFLRLYQKILKMKVVLPVRYSKNIIFKKIQLTFGIKNWSWNGKFAIFKGSAQNLCSRYGKKYLARIYFKKNCSKKKGDESPKDETYSTFFLNFLWFLILIGEGKHCCTLQDIVFLIVNKTYLTSKATKYEFY